MSETEIQRLAKAAADIMMGSCIGRMNVVGMNPAEHVEAAVAVIRKHAPNAFMAAMADAKEAFDCNMHDVGMATFRASMSLAGINAANELAAGKGV